MSKYTSKPTVVALTSEDLDTRFADFSAMQHKIDMLPDDQRAKLGDVQFTADSIVINTNQVGTITLRVAERKPGFVRLNAENSPVPMHIDIAYKPVSESSSEISCEIDVEIPAMLRTFVGPTLQKAADQFGTIFAAMA